MRLTDVENFARRLPTRANLHQPPNGSNEGNINAAQLTDVPPYEQDGRRREPDTAASARRFGSWRDRAARPGVRLEFSQNAASLLQAAVILEAATSAKQQSSPLSHIAAPAHQLSSRPAPRDGCFAAGAATATVTLRCCNRRGAVALPPWSQGIRSADASSRCRGFRGRRRRVSVTIHDRALRAAVERVRRQRRGVSAGGTSADPGTGSVVLVVAYYRSWDAEARSVGCCRCRDDGGRARRGRRRLGGVSGWAAGAVGRVRRGVRSGPDRGSAGGVVSAAAGDGCAGDPLGLPLDRD